MKSEKKILHALLLVILGLSFPRMTSGLDYYFYKGGDWPDSCASVSFHNRHYLSYLQGVQQSPIDIPLADMHTTETHQMTTTQYHTSTSTTQDTSAASHRVLSSAAAVAVPLFTPVPYLKFLTSTNPMSSTTVNNLIKTVQVDFKDASIAFWDETNYMKLYNMLQLHVHAPSEHTFDGQNYDLEVHVVFQSYDQTELSVVGFFFDTEHGGNSENAFVNSLRFNSTNSSWSSPIIPLQDILKKLDQSKIYHYSGSLTTPPCSEIVNWIVVHDVMPISIAQVDMINKRWMSNSTFANGNGNNRATQPLGSRTIYYVGAFSEKLYQSLMALVVSTLIILNF